MGRELDLFGASRSLSRQADRAVARINAGASLDVARVNSVGTVQMAKVDVVGAVTQRAVGAAAFISQYEQSLAQVVPIAATRLEAIATVGCVALTQVIMDTTFALRQI